MSISMSKKKRRMANNILAKATYMPMYLGNRSSVKWVRINHQVKLGVDKSLRLDIQNILDALSMLKSPKGKRIV